MNLRVLVVFVAVWLFGECCLCPLYLGGLAAILGSLDAFLLLSFAEKRSEMNERMKNKEHCDIIVNSRYM